jgi:hypothetical protein
VVVEARASEEERALRVEDLRIDAADSPSFVRRATLRRAGAIEAFVELPC